MANALLRRPEVEARTGLSRSTLYDWMKRGEFPQSVKLGARLVAWRESDIADWLENRPARDSNSPVHLRAKAQPRRDDARARKADGGLA